MVKQRRVNGRDVAIAGNIENLITKLIDQVRVGNMETKERGDHVALSGHFSSVGPSE